MTYIVGVILVVLQFIFFAALFLIFYAVILKPLIAAIAGKKKEAKQEETSKRDKSPKQTKSDESKEAKPANTQPADLAPAKRQVVQRNRNANRQRKDTLNNPHPPVLEKEIQSIDNQKPAHLEEENNVLFDNRKERQNKLRQAMIIKEVLSPPRSLQIKPRKK